MFVYRTDDVVSTGLYTLTKLKRSPEIMPTANTSIDTTFRILRRQIQTLMSNMFDL